MRCLSLSSLKEFVNIEPRDRLILLETAIALSAFCGYEDTLAVGTVGKKLLWLGGLILLRARANR